MNWTRVTKKDPCDVCKHGDWCTRGEKGWGCMRVESDKPMANGGWFHPFGGEKLSTRVDKPKPVPEPPSINPSRLIREWALQTPAIRLAHLASELGVSEDSLAALNAVWAPQHRAWAFPMRDGYGEMVGIRLRSEDGRKWAVRGSNQGVFIPSNGNNCSQTAYITEGPTDTAAALTIGLFAIGRPSCNCGGPEIKTALKRLGIHRAVIVADNDGPGLQGAQRVAAELGVKTVIWIPPTKDIREFVCSGGTAKMIESEVKNFVWKLHKTS